MSSIRQQLFEQAATVSAVCGPLHIAGAVLVDPMPAPDRDAEFGLLVLEDGSAGLYYAWLGGEQAQLRAHFDAADLEHLDALDVARLYLADSDSERSLGLAAINALTACLYRHAGYTPPATTDAMAGMALVPGTRLGMIGHFPPLVRRARAADVEVAVVERKAHMVSAAPGLEISLDPAILTDCDQVICTGATFLNDSFEAMLPWCARAQRIALVGPTVGFFPDVAFARGVAAVAGTRIRDSRAARERLGAGLKLGDAGERTLITATDYPGFDALLARARRR